LILREKVRSLIFPLALIVNIVHWVVWTVGKIVVNNITTDTTAFYT